MDGRSPPSPTIGFVRPRLFLSYRYGTEDRFSLVAKFAVRLRFFGYDVRWTSGVSPSAATSRGTWPRRSARRTWF